eukprot:CAMPEP_0202341966 /NCGR_PEP_ID=MMETSP1126-20121109/2731_1 /ASSEMBLY_ACC=CAM_ASM_000457 /TAXON_ID=3047 /ORGANISM="Dunaliella tertiolecta, Strain CCMP1320" /LENGTH=85 /DNA_ID=CAMNT_0048932851 /DNA_START=806 /DNA_END=1060 /DNA_ORIENTATION=-
MLLYSLTTFFKQVSQGDTIAGVQPQQLLASACKLRASAEQVPHYLLHATKLPSLRHHAGHGSHWGPVVKPDAIGTAAAAAAAAAA